MPETGGPFDPSVIRRFYYLLGHAGIGLTEVRAIDGNGVAGIGFFDSLASLVMELERLDGQANLYVGRNPRPWNFAKRFPSARNKICPSQHTGGASKDIEYLTCLYLDIDPVRASGEPSTNAEHESATTMARTIAADTPGSVAYSTGNGAAIFIPVRQYRVPREFARVERACKEWEASLRAQVEKDGSLKLDFMQDLARIIRIPGTLNVKGTATPDRPHRRAHFIENGLETGILGNILNSRHSARQDEHSTTGDSDVLARIEHLMQRWNKLHDTWTGTRKDLTDTSRSGYDMAVAALLASAGWSIQDITQALQHCPSGRGRQATAAYLTRTVQKALQGR